MNSSYVISDYCAIRRQKVLLHDQMVFEGTETEPGKFFASIYQHFALQYPKFYKMDILCKLGLLSVDILMRDKELQHYSSHETGLVLMNASSSLDTDRHHQNTIIDRNNYFPSPAVFVYTLPNIIIGEISIRHKFTGEGTFFIQKRFDPVFLEHYVRKLMDDEIIQCCIAGWIETDGNEYESVVYFIEKSDRTKTRIANFDAEGVQNIFAKEI
jgi:hypothetical protein